MNERVERLFVWTDVARPMAVQTSFLDIRTKDRPHDPVQAMAIAASADADARGAMFGFDQFS